MSKIRMGDIFGQARFGECRFFEGERPKNKVKWLERKTID